MESKVFRLKRIRAQIRRLLPLFFLFVALLIMVLVRSDSPAVTEIRTILWEYITPVVSVVKRPVLWIKSGTEGVKDLIFTYQNNIELKQENQDLKKWQLQALKLQTENIELKRHFNYKISNKVKEIMAEIVLDEGGEFGRSFVVQAGREQGVKKGMLAFGPVGLFGRITHVGKKYSRLMPMTDYMSHVPVYVGQEKKVAFLIGDNTDRPYLQFTDEKEYAQKNDIVFSSGYMGIYPSNLPIGRVDQENENAPRVLLFENINGLTFVRLIDFGLTENLLSEDLESL